MINLHRHHLNGSEIQKLPFQRPSLLITDAHQAVDKNRKKSQREKVRQSTHLNVPL